MPGYRVTRSAEFDRALKEAGPDDERMAEVMRALEDALSRNPLVGEQLEAGDGHVRMICGHPQHAMPIRFYYRFDGGPNVELIGARSIKM